MELYTPALCTFMFWLIRAQAEIRCHCNAARCVATGYMCKSALGRCFTLLSYDGEHTQSSHGCVDVLARPERDYCAGHGDVLHTRSSGHGWPVLMCCRADMCNYMRDVDVSADPDTRTNRTTWLTADNKEDHDYRWADLDVTQGELWFKAAVIAVPIAGGFILILLVLLAIHMLRSDTKRHKRLVELRKHRSLTKAQLYVADHFTKRGDVTAHEQTNVVNKQNHLYRNVNVKIDCEDAIFGKQLEGRSTKLESCNSVIVWGDERKDSVLTVV